MTESPIDLSQAQSSLKQIKPLSIKNRLLTLNNRTQILILKASTVNLDLMSQKQQAIFLDIYQQFLNSLNLNCQILIQIRPNLSNFQSIIQSQPSSKLDICFRYFYLILSQPANSQTNFDQLFLKAETIKAHFAKLSIDLQILDNQQLFDLLYQSYNPLLKTSKAIKAKSSHLKSVFELSKLNRKSHLLKNQSDLSTKFMYNWFSFSHRFICLF